MTENKARVIRAIREARRRAARALENIDVDRRGDQPCGVEYWLQQEPELNADDPFVPMRNFSEQWTERKEGDADVKYTVEAKIQPKENRPHFKADIQ